MRRDKTSSPQGASGLHASEGMCACVLFYQLVEPISDVRRMLASVDALNTKSCLLAEKEKTVVNVVKTDFASSLLGAR